MKENKTDNKKPVRKRPGKKIVPAPPKFNIMWLYAAIIIALFAVQYLWNSSTTKQINYQQFESEMLIPRDVSKLVTYKNNDLYVVEVYIKPDRLKLDKYKDVRGEGNNFNMASANSPQYKFRQKATGSGKRTSFKSAYSRSRR
jgi:cell division protease FtsH